MMNSKNTTLIGLILITILSIINKVFFIQYGLPFSLHPDEILIYKDPLKLLLLYKEFNFSASTNLFNWLLSVWTILVYLFGKLFGFWASFEEYKLQLVLESGTIIFSFRILALLLTTIGNLLLFRLITLISKDTIVILLSALCIVFNPIENVSTNAIKFDPISYLTFCVLLYCSWNYFIQKSNNKNRIILYLLSFLSITVRVEYFGWIITLIVVDFYINYNKKIVFYIKENWKIFVGGCIIYSLISLYPVVIIYKIIYPNTTSLGTATSFLEFMGKGFLDQILSEKFLQKTIDNFLYYLGIILLVFPYIIFLFISSKKQNGFVLINFSFLIALLFFLIIYIYAAPHYFLIPSLIIIITVIYKLANLSNKKIATISLCIIFLFNFSIALQFTLFVLSEQDSRIVAGKFILNQIPEKSVLAIENYSMNGSYPPLIFECKETYLKKYETIKKSKKGTGETWLAKSNLNPEKCYTIIDIFNTDYFKNTELEGQYIIWKSINELNKKNPQYYICQNDIQLIQDEYYQNLNSLFSLLKSFAPTIKDIRLKKVLEREMYYSGINIYKKNN